MDENITITIESIEIQRKQLVSLTFSDGSKEIVDRKTFAESCYKEGSALTTEMLSALLSLSKENRAKEKALWLLSRKSYSIKELKKKIVEVSDADTANKIIERFQEVGLVNDEQYAESLAREYCEYRHYPKRKAIDKMVEKGIDRDLAKQYVEKSDVDDVASAIAFLYKKCYNSTIDEKAKQKLIQSLVMKGFHYNSVRDAMKQIDESEEE